MWSPLTRTAGAGPGPGSRDGASLGARPTWKGRAPGGAHQRRQPKRRAALAGEVQARPRERKPTSTPRIRPRSPIARQYHPAHRPGAHDPAGYLYLSLITSRFTQGGEVQARPRGVGLGSRTPCAQRCRVRRGGPARSSSQGGALGAEERRGRRSGLLRLGSAEREEPAGGPLFAEPSRGRGAWAHARIVRVIRVIVWAPPSRAQCGLGPAPLRRCPPKRLRSFGGFGGFGGLRSAGGANGGPLGAETGASSESSASSESPRG